MNNPLDPSLTDPLVWQTSRPLRLLLTGSAGAIGRRVGPLLRKRGHFVRGYDLQTPPPGTCDENLTGDLCSPERLQQALSGCDALIHLAATSDEADFVNQLLPNNILGVYHLLEAARHAQVRRWVLASSLQVINALPKRSDPYRVADGVAPSNYYGCTKVFLEAAASMHAHAHGVSAISARLGWFIRHAHELARVRKKPGQAFNMYLSHLDMARFLIRAIEADLPAASHHVLWCMSRQRPPGGYDLAPSEEIIGYQPLDSYPQGMIFFD